MVLEDKTCSNSSKTRFEGGRCFFVEDFLAWIGIKGKKGKDNWIFGFPKLGVHSRGFNRLRIFNIQSRQSLRYDWLF